MVYGKGHISKPLANHILSNAQFLPESMQTEKKRNGMVIHGCRSCNKNKPTCGYRIHQIIFGRDFWVFP